MSDLAHLLRQRAEIPARFAGATLDGCQHADALRAWAKSPLDRDLVLWGPVGTGKTWAATAALREVLARGTRVRWIAVRDLLGRLRAEIGGAPTDTLDDLADTPVVLLDDLGAEWLSGERGEWRREQVATLLGRRYDAARPTLVTTNLDPERLADLDARLASRLLSGLVLRCDGPDRRFA